MCGSSLGESDRAADVEIDISRGQRFGFMWCESCAKEIVERCIK